MGRKPRQHYRGAFYHFIARGNDRQPIFLAHSDRCAFERFFSDGVERFGHRNHAHCWMTNHVHMAVEVAEVPLSHVAHNLLFRYARWFHRKYGRSGHLFERRYRAFPIKTEAALQSLVRYIHLNPVRAAIVDKPGDYPWSSYSAYLDLGSSGPPWLTRSFVLSLFGNAPVDARAALRAFTEREIESGLEDSVQAAASAIDLDSERESNEVLTANPQHGLVKREMSSSLTLEKLLCAASSACSLSRSDLSANTQRRSFVRGRSLAAFIVNKTPHLTLEQLGSAVGRDASTLSRAADNIARRLAGNPKLRDLLTDIEENLSLERN